MRTTVTLEPDVQAAVDRLREEHGMGLSEAVNELMRGGLRRRAPRKPFTQRVVDVGVTVDVSNVAEALDLLDDEPPVR